MTQPFVSALVRATDTKKALNDIDKKVKKATMAGVRENQNVIKKNIRRKLRGKPRWGQRGASPKYGTPAFKVEGFTKRKDSHGHSVANEPRSGTPGKFSGALYGGVKSRRIPKWMGENGVSGWVKIGNRENNVKKGKLELKFPYFAPAVKESQPEVSANFEKGWSKAITKSGGF